MTKKNMQITAEVHPSEVLLIRISTCHLFKNNSVVRFSQISLS